MQRQVKVLGSVPARAWFKVLGSVPARALAQQLAIWLSGAQGVQCQWGVC